MLGCMLFILARRKAIHHIARFERKVQTSDGASEVRR